MSPDLPHLRSPHHRAAVSPAGMAVLAGVLLAAYQWANWSSAIAWSGDNDNMMRLVQVRDLLAGQGWFDLHQYRMGFDGGFVMHWSRLVDAPIAALMVIFGALTRSAAAGETLALVVWPSLLLCAAVYFLSRAARSIAGPDAIVPAGFLALVTLLVTGKFSAGAIDHHNVQFVLTAASLCFLLEARTQPRMAIGAGIAAGLSICIGMETAPYVACAGLIAAGSLLLNRTAPSAAIGFGCGFAVTTAVAFLATVGPSAWSAVACDTLSLPHLACAAIGGLGLAVAGLAKARSSSGPIALSILIVTAAIAGVTVATFFPQCLAAPYSDLDPRQQAWIGTISEVRSIRDILGQPALAAGLFATPILALFVCFREPASSDRKAGLLLAAVFLSVASLLAAWQIRGAPFALGLATVPLAVWIASCLAAARNGVAGAAIGLLLACVLALNLSWSLFARQVTAAVAASPAPVAATADCSDRDYQSLRRYPATTVLSDINGAVPVLLHTGHRALAGPYHRNTGTLLAFDIAAAEPDAARSMLSAHGIGVIAFCTADSDRKRLGKLPEGSLHARIMRNEVPLWLQPADAGLGRLRIFEVRN